MKIEIKQKIDHTKDLIEQILEYRGLTKEWLNADEKYFLDGSIMHNFGKGRELILKNILDNSKIGIIVDNDMDGIGSAAIIHQWLLDRNCNLNIHPIITEGKVHGIIHDLVPKDLDLLIIPDASSSENEKHDEIAKMNIPILILDHHELSQKESTSAVIINPCNPNCSYENKNLSGAGVVFKFIEAMDKLDGFEYYQKYIDLAAVAIVGDMMDLKSMENKAIVNIGLKNIQNRYFQAYLKADGRIKGKTVNPILISFYLVPQINALIRMATAEEKQELYQAIIGEIPPEPVIASVTKIKNSQDNKKKSLIPRIVLNLQRQDKEHYNIIMAISPVNTPKAMTGLIAGQLASLYSKPALLGRIDNGKFIGSARSINNSNIENLKDFCEDSKLFDWVAGHQSAFGLQMPEENMDKFLEYCEKNLPPFEKIYYVDLKLEGNKLELVEKLTELNDHAGPGFDEVRIYDEIYITNEDINILGEKQNTMLISKDGLEYIQFNTKKVPQSGSVIRIIGKCNINDFRGQQTPQVIIEDWEETQLIL